MTGPTLADLDDRERAIWHLENALDALRHPDYLAVDRDPAEVMRAARVAAEALEALLLPPPCSAEPDCWLTDGHEGPHSFAEHDARRQAADQRERAGSEAMA